MENYNIYNKYTDKPIFECHKYLVFFDPKHHLADSNGLVYLHRAVAECDILHRPIKDEEVVHHIDGNKLNDKPENLIVFKDNAEHAKYHLAIRNNAEYELINNDGIYSCIYHKSPKKYYCPLCGKEKTRGMIFCADCSEKKDPRFKYIWNEEKGYYDKIGMCPTKEELIELIKSDSILGISKKYQVSDNAIRKWLIKNNLPYRREDIKEYFKR